MFPQIFSIQYTKKYNDDLLFLYPNFILIFRMQKRECYTIGSCKGDKFLFIETPLQTLNFVYFCLNHLLFQFHLHCLHIFPHQ
jgi:hypothetical protein